MERRIILFGNSVVMGTIAASLQRSAALDIVHILSSDYQILKDAVPDVIIFDLEATRPETFFPLLETCSGLMVVGISPDANIVKVWMGQQLRELSTQDLIKVIS